MYINNFYVAILKHKIIAKIINVVKNLDFRRRITEKRSNNSLLIVL